MLVLGRTVFSTSLLSVSDIVVGINFQGLRGNDIGMNIYQVWQQGITGKGVVVAVVDEGLQQSHPELADNYVGIVNRPRNDVVCAKLKVQWKLVKSLELAFIIPVTQPSV